MDQHIAVLREYLRSAGIDCVLEPEIAGGAHPDKFKVLLDGGVSCLVKPENGAQETARAVMCEEAASIVAAELGWTDLVAVTVQREINTPDERTVNAAVQVLWLDPADDPQPLGQFEEEDLWRAAIFDVVVEHGDHKHNWMAAPKILQPPMLRLYDNAYAFGMRPLQSSFFDLKQGQTLPGALLEDLRRFLEAAPATELTDVLPQEAFEQMLSRVRNLVETGKLVYETNSILK